MDLAALQQCEVLPTRLRATSHTRLAHIVADTIFDRGELGQNLMGFEVLSIRVYKTGV